jgi:hypothetical protein
MSGLRIEVTSRQAPSLEELRDELDMDLEGAGYQIEIQCEVAPVRISNAERELFADQASLEARAVVVRGAGCPSSVVAAIDQVREAFRPTLIHARSPKQLLAYACQVSPLWPQPDSWPRPAGWPPPTIDISISGLMQ